MLPHRFASLLLLAPLLLAACDDSTGPELAPGGMDEMLVLASDSSLRTIREDGSLARQYSLPDGPLGNLRWSQDGRSFLGTRQDATGAKLLRVSVDGTSSRTLVSRWGSIEALWSGGSGGADEVLVNGGPGGTDLRIGLWRVRGDGTPPVLLRPFPLGCCGYRVSVSPNGRRYLLIETPVGTNRGTKLWFGTVGAAAERLVSEGLPADAYYAGLSWAPDSRSVAIDWRGTAGGIFRVWEDGRASRVVQDTVASVPTFSPDGKWIAFRWRRPNPGWTGSTFAVSTSDGTVRPHGFVASCCDDTYQWSPDSWEIAGLGSPMPAPGGPLTSPKMYVMQASGAGAPVVVGDGIRAFLWRPRR